MCTLITYMWEEMKFELHEWVHYCVSISASRTPTGTLGFKMPSEASDDFTRPSSLFCNLSFPSFCITSAPKENTSALRAVSASMPWASKQNNWSSSRTEIAAPWVHLTSSAMICKLGLIFTVARGANSKLRLSWPASVCCANLHQAIALVFKCGDLSHRDTYGQKQTESTNPDQHQKSWTQRLQKTST